VVLSACNTAPGSATEADVLSGLARAFFYAGAGALLVSHWAVYSHATVKLITQTVGAMALDKTVGRSEALRRSMIALIRDGEAHEAHPAYWGLSYLVGRERQRGRADKRRHEMLAQPRPSASRRLRGKVRKLRKLFATARNVGMVKSVSEMPPNLAYSLQGRGVTGRPSAAHSFWGALRS
jgi:hypothetical protein